MTRITWPRLLGKMNHLPWIACATSAFFGALLALWFSGRDETRQALAQEPILRAPWPGTPPQSGWIDNGRPTSPQPDDLAGYTTEERVNIAVYENVNRSVVNITTKATGTALLVFEVPTEGAGSGSVLDQEGHILTNYHVVEGARQIEVTLFDGKSYDGRLVGRDATYDIAVLKIDAPPESLFPVQFGETATLRVGQRVYAIGNPFGLERTLTTGIVSSLNRSLPTRNSARVMKNIIQIDAAINPGNSGGPLVNTRGQLIGMNTAIASKTGQNTGVGFAIPASTLSRVVVQLIERGQVIRPETGITRVYQTEQGLLIATLVPGGPAERAGLRGFQVVREKRRHGPFVYEHETVDRSAADLIVGVDGEKITSAEEFLSLIDAHPPGDEAVLNIIRQGRETQVRLILAAGES